RGCRHHHHGPGPSRPVRAATCGPDGRGDGRARPRGSCAPARGHAAALRARAKTASWLGCGGESGTFGGTHYLHVAAGKAGATILVRPAHPTDPASGVPAACHHTIHARFLSWHAARPGRTDRPPV